jgi:ankyrin repeat protein
MATKTKLNIYELLLLTPEEANKMLREEFWKEIPDLELIGDILAYTLVDVNVKDNGGRTALVFAADWGNEKLVELLLNHPEIDVNLRPKEGYGPLMRAANGGFEKCVKLLLGHPGIDVNVQTGSNWTALMIAAYNENVKCVDMLLNHPGIDITLKNKGGNTAWDLIDKRTKKGKLIKVLFQNINPA